MLTAEFAAPVLGVLDIAGDRSEHRADAVQVGVPGEIKVHYQTRLAPENTDRLLVSYGWRGCNVPAVAGKLYVELVFALPSIGKGRGKHGG